jgi:hypothetical protein
MSFHWIYESEPISKHGRSRVGGDDGLYRIKVSKKYQDGRKELSHYMDGEFNKKVALQIASEKNSQFRSQVLQVS